VTPGGEPIGRNPDENTVHTGERETEGSQWRGRSSSPAVIVMDAENVEQGARAW
jgi:hypothetical protein